MVVIKWKNIPGTKHICIGSYVYKLQDANKHLHFEAYKIKFNLIFYILYPNIV